MKKFIKKYIDVWVLGNVGKSGFEKKYSLNILDIFWAILSFPLYLIFLLFTSPIIKLK
jgi:hypothetical protein